MVAYDSLVYVSPMTPPSGIDNHSRFWLSCLDSLVYVSPMTKESKQVGQIRLCLSVPWGEVIGDT
jgi:hypothetical protein